MAIHSLVYVIAGRSASLRAFSPVFNGLWTRVNALMPAHPSRSRKAFRSWMDCRDKIQLPGAAKSRLNPCFWQVPGERSVTTLTKKRGHPRNLKRKIEDGCKNRERDRNLLPR